jgi:hypothetical protein
MANFRALVSIGTLVLASGCGSEGLGSSGVEADDAPTGNEVDTWGRIRGELPALPGSKLPEEKPLGSALEDLDRRWPDGVVNYIVSGAVSPADRDTIEMGMKFWSLRSRVQFVEGPAADTVVILPSDDAASWSETGRFGGSQPLYWAAGDDLVTAIHELGHTLGLRHEHNRSDRDNHIEVCWLNIHPTYVPYFQLEDADVDLLTPYDDNSIMHYYRRSAHVAEVDPNVQDLGTGSIRRLGEPGCFEPIVGLGLPEFRGNDLTAEDINAVNLMYGTPLASAEAGDKLGSSVIFSYMDGEDSWPEIVTGAPGEDVDTVSDAGAVYVFRGTYRRPTPWRVITQETDWEGPEGLSVPALDVSEARDQFGAALASAPLRYEADFEHSSLSVGAPGETVPGPSGTDASSGAVYVYEAVREGVRPLHRLVPSQASGETNTNGARFGAALANADFDGDGKHELIVGSPGKNAGKVHIYSGVSLGTSIVASQIKVLSPSVEVVGADFGGALATGDFNHDGKLDLAVGAPNAGSNGAGKVYVYTGNGATSFGSLAFTLWQTLVPPSAELDDDFGASLASLQLQLGGWHALAVGAPNKRKIGPNVRTGAVYVYDHYPLLMQPPILKLETTSFPGSNEIQRFGERVAALPPDGAGFDKLVITAPTASGGRGRGAILHGGPTNMTFFMAIDTAPDVSRMGSSIATGSVREDTFHPFDPDAMGPVQIVLGAPSDPYFFDQNVGSLYGFHVGQNAVHSRFEYTQRTSVPWAP